MVAGARGNHKPCWGLTLLSAACKVSALHTVLKTDTNKPASQPSCSFPCGPGVVCWAVCMHQALLVSGLGPTSPLMSPVIPGIQPAAFAFPCATLLTMALAFVVYVSVRSSAQHKDTVEVGWPLDLGNRGWDIVGGWARLGRGRTRDMVEVDGTRLGCWGMEVLPGP